VSLYLLLVLIVVMVVFSKVQTNRRRKHALTLEDAIRPGVRAVTTAGIYGIVVEIETDTIVLEISEGVDVRFAKAAVVRVVPHLDDDLDDDLDDAADDLDTGLGKGDVPHDADAAHDLDAAGRPAEDAQVGKSHKLDKLDKLDKEVMSSAGNERGTGSVSGA
jgi:preprotein translocase subunit YajC